MQELYKKLVFFAFYCTGFVAAYPSFGNMLGGTFVILSGPCFDETDAVECDFAGTTTPGVYVSNHSVACITPALNSVGNVEVSLNVITPDGAIRFQGSSTFYSSKSKRCRLYLLINKSP